MRTMTLGVSNSGQNSTEGRLGGRKITHFCGDVPSWRAIQENVLARYPQVAGATASAPMHGFSGAWIWRCERAGEGYCLRAWPPQMRDSDRLCWMHQALIMISGDCGLVPAPMPRQEGGTWVDWQGRYWEVTRWMPGTADYHEQASPERLVAAVSSLAEFHLNAAQAMQGGAAQGCSPALQRRARMLAGLDRQEIERMGDAVKRGRTDVDAAVAQAAYGILRCLPHVIPAVTRQLRQFMVLRVPLQICHGDLWHDHVLFSDAHVSGFIDFGNLRIDSPSSDLARLLGSLVGDDVQGWRSGLDAYERLVSLGDEPRRLLHVFDRTSVLLGGVNWVRWIYCDGRHFPWSTVGARMESIRQRLAALI